MPAVRIDTSLLCDDCRRAYSDDIDELEDDDEIDLLAMLSDVRDEVEAALDHLDRALSDLLPEDE